MLRLRDVDVAHGDAQVIWSASLDVEEGEIVALVGGNGAGKTTILRTISGLLRPRAGRIEFGDRRIDRMAAHEIVRAGIAHVPEGRRLFPLLSVRDNLELGGFSHARGEEERRTVAWVFELFPRLAERQGQLAGTLSGGEQQMVAIGRALMARPRLLLMDEPSLGLAPTVVEMIFETLRALKDCRLTTLLVEQNIAHALAIADRGYVLEHGRITAEGQGRVLLEDPEIKKAYLGL